MKRPRCDFHFIIDHLTPSGMFSSTKRCRKMARRKQARARIGDLVTFGDRCLDHYDAEADQQLRREWGVPDEK